MKQLNSKAWFIDMKGLIIDPDKNDLEIRSGHLAIGETSRQTAEAVVVSMRGEWKELPLLGGEAQIQLAGSGDVMWGGRVLEMLQVCGVECDEVKIVEGGTIEII